MNLKNGQEIIGTMKDVQHDDEIVKITFLINYEIEVPRDKIHYKNLQKLIGNRIGILNINDSYKIRIINGGKKTRLNDSNTFW